MTLCKHRPKRTYDEQYIIEQNDVNGLLKMLDAAVGALAEEGDAAVHLYAGAYLGFKTMFECAQRDGCVDMWTDFLAEFEKEIEKLEGGL